jgi:hypothetical protein
MTTREAKWSSTLWEGRMAFTKLVGSACSIPRQIPLQVDAVRGCREMGLKKPHLFASDGPPTIGDVSGSNI